MKLIIINLKTGGNIMAQNKTAVVIGGGLGGLSVAV